MSAAVEKQAGGGGYARPRDCLARRRQRMEKRPEKNGEKVDTLVLYSMNGEKPEMNNAAGFAQRMR